MNNILIQKRNSAVIIFAKYPEPGKVKTRLASSTNNDFAAEFYKICAEHIFHEIHKRKAQGFLFLPISDNTSLVKSWAGNDFIYKHQIGNSLGDKMRNAFDEVFKLNFNSAVIIGTDIPEITCETIESALNHLEKMEVVIAPSDDGGYSLLGMKKSFPFLFTGIEWSTDKVYSSTIEKMKQQNINYKVLSALCDVDTLDDLKKYLQQKNTSRIHKDILRISNKMGIEL